MIVGVAGHRPDKLDVVGYPSHSSTNPLRHWIRAQLRARLLVLRPLYTISGMAQGVDWDFVEVSIELGIPFIAAVPFAGQEDRWPLAARQRYRALLRQAYEVYVISEGGYSRDAMMVRNAWVVEHINELVAVWNGTEGGTSNTVHYALRIGRDITHIDPRDFRLATTV